MKNKLFRLYSFFTTVDHRYVQMAYLVVTLGLIIFHGTSEEMGSGTR